MPWSPREAERQHELTPHAFGKLEVQLGFRAYRGWLDWKVVYTKSTLQSFMQEITGIPRFHMEMRAGSSVLQPIVYLSIEIKFRDLHLECKSVSTLQPSPKACILGWVRSSLCCRMNLSTVIIFCFLILGVSSQGWGTFLKEAGQGKDKRMGWGGCVCFPRIQLSRGHIPIRQRP